MKLNRIFRQYNHKVEAIFTTIECGNMSFKWPGKNIVKNREQVFEVMGWDLNKLIMANQPHGIGVVSVDIEKAGAGARDTSWVEGFDSIISNDSRVILGVETADCLPVFAYDPQTNYIGVCHAGWKGVVAGAVKNFVTSIVQHGVQIRDIQIYIGPHIRDCCFEIKNDILNKFKDWEFAIKRRDEKIFVDLCSIVVDQLTKLDLPRQNIEMSKDCTSCREDKYYSYRRDKGKCIGSMMGFIKLKQ